MSDFSLRHIRPNAAQLKQRQSNLRWQRRQGCLQRLVAPRRPERKLLAGLKNSHSLTLGAHAPLATLDACGFRYPRMQVKVKSLKRQVADWVVVAQRGRRNAGELAALPVFNSIDYFILQGVWRPLLLKHMTAAVEQEARELYKHNFAYQKTDCYQTLLAKLNGNAKLRRQGDLVTDKAQLDAYFERFCVLFKSIETHGVLPPEQVRRNGLTTNLDRPLGIAMGANGKLHRLQGGNHRWAIAKVLGIEKVEVELRLIHPDIAHQVLELLSSP